MAHEINIKINALTPSGAISIAKLLEKIGNNIDKSALTILAKKSEKAGMSDKVRKYKSFM